jgi:hypothetical protein
LILKFLGAKIKLSRLLEVLAKNVRAAEKTKLSI